MALVAMRAGLLREAADLKGEGESGVAAERCGRVRTGRKEIIGRPHGPLNLSGIESCAAPDRRRLAAIHRFTTSGMSYQRSIAILGTVALLDNAASRL
jgi:hypothetical protein